MSHTFPKLINSSLRIGLALTGGFAIGAQDSLPFPAPPSASKAGKSLADSVHKWRQPASHLPADAPNILIIMLDDAGFAQSDTVGGAIHTPTLQRIMDTGIRYNTFHVAAISSATRAALLTGRNNHHVGNGVVTEVLTDFDGYTGMIPDSASTVAEVLRQYGYNTVAFGKWHNTPVSETTPMGPFNHWPTGYGFEHFYGFIAGETDEYSPRLYDDTTPIEPPHDPKYHLSEDLGTRAVDWLHNHQNFAPNKPFFMYWAPGAVHAPHQVFKEWADKYKGKFDSGWDAYRQTAFEHQKAMGWIPKDTQLTPRPDGLRAWDSLSDQEKKFQARLMEVYAGFMEHVDTQAGRIIDELEREGKRDNTLIFYVFGDNGASAEGAQGTVNQMLVLNGIPTTVQQQMQVVNQLGGLDVLGGDKVEEHYNAAWAWAGESPFQGTKLVAGYFGGTRTPLAVSWPKQIKPDTAIRSQFHDVDDIVPTIYDVLSIKPPKSVKGVEQIPLDGISMRYTFNDAKVETRKHEQYFETFGSRAMYKDGWIAAVFGPRKPWLPGFASIATWKPEDDVWSLYDLRNDYSEAFDIAKDHPQKLEELKQAFDKAARENNVYPLGAGVLPIVHPEQMARPGTIRGDWHFGEEMTRLPEFAAPNLRARNSLVNVDADFPQAASGVLYALGGIGGGITLYVDHGIVHYEYNALGLARIKIVAPAPLAGGRHQIEVETTMTAAKQGAPAVLTVRIDGVAIGKGTTPFTPPLLFSASETFDVGMDLGSPVSLDYFDRAPFKFEGKIFDVHVMYR